MVLQAKATYEEAEALNRCMYVIEKPENDESTIDEDQEVKRKLVIRFRKVTKEESPTNNKSTSKVDANRGDGEKNGGSCNGDDQVGKPWNLRPKQPVSKRIPFKFAECSNIGESQEKKKFKKPTFSISLAREEIEVDMLAMTGSKPTRKPTKRPKNIQKQLNNLFPGLGLRDITSDKYKP